MRALTPAVVREWYASALRSRGGRTSISSTSIRRVAGISRDDIEDYEVWPSGSPGVKGALSANTHRQRLQTLRAFLERLIEWDWPDAPPRNPVLGGDIPEKPRAAAEVPRRPRHRTLPVPARRRRRTAARHQRHLTHLPQQNNIHVTAATRVPLLPQSRWLAGMAGSPRWGNRSHRPPSRADWVAAMIMSTTVAMVLGGGVVLPGGRSVLTPVSVDAAPSA